MPKIVLDKEKLTRLYKIEKQSIRDISLIMGTTEATVRNRLLEYGLHTQKRKNVSQELLDRIEYLYVTQKKSADGIARLIGRSHTFVLKALYEAGVQIRTTRDYRRAT